MDKNIRINPCSFSQSSASRRPAPTRRGLAAKKLCIMKTLLVLFAAIALFASCNKSGTADFRAHSMYYSTYTFSYLPNETVEIISADSAFHVGDTIENGSTHYVLLSKVH